MSQVLKSKTNDIVIKTPGKVFPISKEKKIALVTSIKTDENRDANLTDFGKATLADRYLYKDESYQDMFSRVASAYQDDIEHGQRIYDYMSRLWFMPATPILSNGGTDRGLPISCFLNSVNDLSLIHI